MTNKQTKSGQANSELIIFSNEINKLQGINGICQIIDRIYEILEMQEQHAKANLEIINKICAFKLSCYFEINKILRITSLTSDWELKSISINLIIVINRYRDAFLQLEQLSSFSVRFLSKYSLRKYCIKSGRLTKHFRSAFIKG